MQMGRGNMTKLPKKVFVVSIVLALLMGVVPASASRLLLSTGCVEELPWGATEIAYGNTSIRNPVLAVQVKGTAYRNGAFSTFSGGLTKPASSVVQLQTGISNFTVVLGYDGNFFIYQGDSQHTGELMMNVDIMYANGGRCWHNY